MTAYRFRDRLPQPGEGKSVYAELNATRVTATDGSQVGVLWLYDCIDSWGGYFGVSANEVRQAIEDLGTVSAIHLHINSPGGEVTEGMAIKNILASCGVPVTAIVDGLAASIASVIAVCADELVMMPNSELMMHDAWGAIAGPAADFRDFANVLDKVSDDIAGVYAAKSGGDAAEWRAKMQTSLWLMADEAVEMGLADSVGGSETAEAVVGTISEGAEDPGLLIAAFTLDSKDKIRAQKALRNAVRGVGAVANAQTSDPAPVAIVRIDDALDAADVNMLTQAMGWFTAVDNIVDQAQAALAEYLNVENPDSDDGADDSAESEAMAYLYRAKARLNRRKA
ncbi:MAG: hypothetical protein NVS3B1_26320 [Marmoricola sp.]